MKTPAETADTLAKFATWRLDPWQPMSLRSEEIGPILDDAVRMLRNMHLLTEACHVFLDAQKHGGYGMEDAEKAIRNAINAQLPAAKTTAN